MSMRSRTPRPRWPSCYLAQWLAKEHRDSQTPSRIRARRSIPAATLCPRKTSNQQIGGSTSDFSVAFNGCSAGLGSSLVSRSHWSTTAQLRFSDLSELPIMHLKSPKIDETYNSRLWILPSYTMRTAIKSTLSHSVFGLMTL